MIFIAFTAIKIGDLNHSAINTQDEALEDRTSNHFILANLYLEKGTLVEVPVYAESIQNIHGFQGSINLEGVELIEIKSGQLEMAPSNYHEIESNHFNISWNGAIDKTYQADEALYYIVIRSNYSGYFNEVFSQSTKGINAEIYTESESVPLAFSIKNMTQTENAVENVLYQNEPNPFIDETKITFSLAQEGMAQLTIF